MKFLIKKLTKSGLNYNFDFHITYKKHEKNKYYSVNFITHKEPQIVVANSIFGLIWGSSPYIKFC